MYSKLKTVAVTLCFILLAPPHLFAQCESHVLAALDESIESGSQHFTASVWTLDPHCPVSGTILIESNPPGAAVIGGYIESFFDVFMEVHTVKPPITSVFPPEIPFEIITHVTFTDPVYPPQTYLEQVVRKPDGRLAIFQPTPCTPEVVPVSIAQGGSACLQVCHRIYTIDLGSSLTMGRPIIQITPGCFGTAPGCPLTPCMPGGILDYRYDIYSLGGRWILEFEYSNPQIQPVCYCVAYVGNLPADCMTHELAALNEVDQSLDLTLWTSSPGGVLCPANGNLEIFSYPAGALIGPHPSLFNGIGPDWYTVTTPVAAGSFPPGSTFELIAYIRYAEPAYPKVWKVESVRVREDGTGLEIYDTDGHCPPGTDFVPDIIYPNQSTCFRVCHRIYYSMILWPATSTMPVVSVTPGCFGPPEDQCIPWIDCLPGGLFDYRYAVVYRDGQWWLEFEYSNPEREPVCYCIFVEPTPCYPVRDLVIQWPDSASHSIRLAWTSPQHALYRIYSTTAKNNDSNPPGIIWTMEGEVWGTDGEQIIWIPSTVINTDYLNFVVKADCGPFPEKH